MITATIGKIFLEAYNKKFGSSYDAKSFFVDVYYPLFFDSNKYLQWIQNSPFVQMEKGQKVETLTQAERKEKWFPCFRRKRICNHIRSSHEFKFLNLKRRHISFLVGFKFGCWTTRRTFNPIFRQANPFGFV